MSTIAGIAGKKCPHFTVGSFSGQRRNKEMLWNCYCNCGKDFLATETEINTEEVTSCGCKKKEEIRLEKLSRSSALSCGKELDHGRIFRCRVRGCPSCEAELDIPRSESIAKFLKYYHECNYWLLHLPCPNFELEELRKGIAHCHNSFHRLVNLQETKVAGFARFTKIGWSEKGEHPLLTIHSVIATPLSTASSCSVNWESIWLGSIQDQVDCPTIERYYDFEQLKGLAAVDITLVPNDKALKFREQIAKLHLFSTSTFDTRTSASIN